MRFVLPVLLVATFGVNAQDIKLNLRVKNPPRTAQLIPVTAPKSGAGCFGSRPQVMVESTGCAGYRQRQAPVMYEGGGCQATRSTGCYGSMAGAMGFPPPAATYGVPVGTVYGAVAQGRMTGPQAYYSGAARYGQRVSVDEWATPTGAPPGPGIVGIPGAPFPADGPIRRFARDVSGFDPGYRRR